MKSHEASNYLGLGLAALVFFLIIFTKLAGSNVLFSLDPWKHNIFAQFGEGQRFLSNTVQLHNGLWTLSYLSSMRSIVYALSLVSNVDTFSIMRFGSLFLRVAYLLLAFSIFHTFTQKRSVSAISSVMIFSSPYFIWRSFITFPENLAMLFHLLTIWSLENYRQKRANAYLIILTLSLAGVIYAHPPSLFFSGLIIAAYFIDALIARDHSAMKALFVSAVIATLLAFPIWKSTFIILRATIASNVGETAPFASTVIDDPRYKAPTLQTYLDYAGVPIALFSLFGFVSALKERAKHRRAISLLFVFTFVLSLGSLIDIFVPTDRMQSYFLIPATILAALYIGVLFSKSSATGRTLLSSAIFLLALIATTQAEPWFAYWHGEMEIAEQIESILEADENTLVQMNATSAEIAGLLSRPEQICFDPATPTFEVSNNQGQQAACEQARFWVVKEIPIVEWDYAIQRFGIFYLIERLSGASLLDY